jgi:hypothetical protein
MLFKGVRGIVVAYQISMIEGPFCRDCASYFYHDRQRHTLLWGWWFLAYFMVPVFVLVNRVEARRFTRMPGPVPTPGVKGPVGGPLPPGRGLLPLWLYAAIAAISMIILVCGPLGLLVSSLE